MDERLAELVNRSWKEKPRRYGKSEVSFSGAAISGGVITIVTIACNQDGSSSIDRSRSIQLQRIARDQAAIRRTYASLQIFVRKAQISVMHLRLGASSGPHRAKAETHLCEAVLSLLPDVTIEHVAPQSLAAWSNANRRELPRQADERSWQLAWMAAKLASEGSAFSVGTNCIEAAAQLSRA